MRIIKLFIYDIINYIRVSVVGKKSDKKNSIDFYYSYMVFAFIYCIDNYCRKIHWIITKMIRDKIAM